MKRLNPEMPALSKDEQAVATQTVTRKELIELRDAEETLTKASRAKSLAEHKVKPLRMALAEKVLGVKTEAEYRAWNPDEILRIINRRMDHEAFEVVRGCPSFVFEQTAAGRYVAWQSAYISEMGQAAADRLTAETPTLYSYRVHVD